MSTICLLGLGYIGLPTGSMFALAGNDVIGVDPSPRVQSALRSGLASIDEPELQTLVTAAIKSGRLRVQTRPELADAFIIAVPTPFDPTTNQADLHFVEQAARDILPFLRRGNLVVLESTVPPGTTRDVLAPILAESGLQPGRDICLAHCPERVLPGRILVELEQNDRLAGGLTPGCADKAAELYSAFVKGSDHAHQCHHRRDGQGDGKHVPRRQRRAGQRVCARRRADRRRRVGGDSIWPTITHASTSCGPVRAWAATASPSTRGSWSPPRPSRRA